MNRFHVILFFLGTATAAAQSLPDAPSFNNPGLFRSASTAVVAPKPTALNPWDRPSVLIEAFKWSAVVADIETTKAAVGSGTCQESVPLYGNHPTRLRLYGIMGGIEAAHSFVSYRFRKSGRGQRLTRITAFMSGAGHAFAAVSNARCM